MSIICKIVGHRRLKRVWIDGGDYKSKCRWCEAEMIRFGHQDWRLADVEGAAAAESEKTIAD